MQKRMRSTNWSDIRIFLAVARAGSLGAAARATGQSQPTMGRRLKALEAHLGLPLFQRSADGFLLTDEGALVLTHAERMEEEALAFDRALAGQEDRLSGPLRTSSSDWFGVHILAPIFAGFQQAHPLVTIELLTDSRLFDLARRETDLGFRHTPFEHGDIVQRRLMRIDYGLYGAAGLPRPRAGDGRGTPLVTMDMAFGSMPDVGWLKEKLPHAHVAMRSNNREVQAMLCASGSGWAVLPRLLGDRIPGLQRAALRSPPPSREMFVGYHKDLRRLVRLRRLLDHVVTALAA
jgi:DNA-binding transcriptional LysR family regulator